MRKSQLADLPRFYVPAPMPPLPLPAHDQRLPIVSLLEPVLKVVQHMHTLGHAPLQQHRDGLEADKQGLTAPAHLQVTKTGVPLTWFTFANS